MMCPVYHLEVSGVGKSTGKLKTLFAQLDLYVLSSVPNIHPEEQCKMFPHLKGIWFSGVSAKENLSIHATLGVKDFANIKLNALHKERRANQ